jgi:hypothetical protein
LKNASSDKGLKAGIKGAISVVVLIVIGFVALIIIQKRKGVGYRGRNSVTDPSETLQIDADGDVLQESVKSLTSPHNEFDFENPIFQDSDDMAVEVERPKTPSYENGNSNGRGGHGRII